MTKLEEKLLELGYKLVGYTLNNCPKYCKFSTHNDKDNNLCIVTSKDKNEIYYHGVYCLYAAFETQQNIDGLQQAFNVLQEDLTAIKLHFD